jgi:hypothetical protein
MVIIDTIIIERKINIKSLFSSHYRKMIKNAILLLICKFMG